jgi:3-deoxy-7-phosphoheptulonate synthase
MPVGFKNGTSGDCQVAVDACRAAAGAHSFLSVSKQGVGGIVQTGGNEDCHLILRGGSDGPNYSDEHVTAACATLAKGKLRQSLIVDCSHGNSKKIHTNQPIVAADVAARVAKGDTKMAGLMLESFLKPGRQDIPKPKPAANAGSKRSKQEPKSPRFGGLTGASVLADMEYGMSVTDACMDWDMTQAALDGLAASVKARRALKKK